MDAVNFDGGQNAKTWRGGGGGGGTRRRRGLKGQGTLKFVTSVKTGHGVINGAYVAFPSLSPLWGTVSKYVNGSFTPSQPMWLYQDDVRYGGRRNYCHFYVEKPELTSVPAFTPGKGQNIALYSSPTAKNFFLFLISTFRVTRSGTLRTQKLRSPSVENPELTNVLPLKPG